MDYLLQVWFPGYLGCGVAVCFLDVLSEFPVPVGGVKGLRVDVSLGGGSWVEL